ncbi:hypothetical protein GEMRC1_000778 [Eukaryota sp. GEM-RC1]
MTETLLRDGRTVFIAGEHEDYYDPDFYIYNDVVVESADCSEYTIYTYPKEIFPPTDFHFSFLLPDRIIIIGSMGYQQTRTNETPIFSLSLTDFSISHIQTSKVNPGRLNSQNCTMSHELRNGMHVFSAKQNGVYFEISDRNWYWVQLEVTANRKI